jgi:serine/threonine-protein kinase
MAETLSNGTILRGRYKLTNVVGQGGMGNVYRAEDTRLPGRICAVKEIQSSPTATAETRKQEQQQFLREASLLAQLDHPNLPKVSDFFTQDGVDYLVMDYVPGSNLKELIDDSRAQGALLAPDVVLDWGKQLLDAIRYLHQQDPPILHRDIKPANIKLTPDNRIKLVDFGLAKVLAGDDSRTITVIQGRGTAYYTPLEQYGGESEHTDVRSDIYAVGATFYHLLSGKPPPEARARFLNPNVLRPLNEINKPVSKNLAELIKWALEMHPDDRPKTIAALEDAIFKDGRRPKSGKRQVNGSTLSYALRENAAMAFVVIFLLLLALVLTIR